MLWSIAPDIALGPTVSVPSSETHIELLALEEARYASQPLSVSCNLWATRVSACVRRNGHARLLRMMLSWENPHSGSANLACVSIAAAHRLAFFGCISFYCTSEAHYSLLRIHGFDCLYHAASSVYFRWDCPGSSIQLELWTALFSGQTLLFVTLSSGHPTLPCLCLRLGCSAPLAFQIYSNVVA